MKYSSKNAKAGRCHLSSPPLPCFRPPLSPAKECVHMSGAPVDILTMMGSGACVHWLAGGSKQ